MESGSYGCGRDKKKKRTNTRTLALATAMRGASPSCPPQSLVRRLASASAAAAASPAPSLSASWPTPFHCYALRCLTTTTTARGKGRPHSNDRHGARKNGRGVIEETHRRGGQRTDVHAKHAGPSGGGGESKRQSYGFNPSTTSHYTKVSTPQQSSLSSSKRNQLHRTSSSSQHRSGGHHSSFATATPTAATAAAAAAATGAFHAFLHQQNSPYTRSSETSQGAALTTNADAQLHAFSHHHGGGTLAASLQSRSAASGVDDFAEEGRRQLDEREEGEGEGEGGGRGGGVGGEVLQEWTLAPTSSKATHPSHDAAQRKPALSTARDDAESISRKRDGLSSQVTRGQREEADTTHQQQQEQQRRRRRREERYALIDQARQSTAVALSHRHRRAYEQRALQCYQLITRIEGSLVEWSRQRYRSHRVMSPSSMGKEQSVEDAQGQSRSDVAAAQDVDAVDARFFEVAGQLQRTLHQLTPPHFDAMRGYRLHRRERSAQRISKKAKRTTMKETAGSNTSTATTESAFPASRSPSSGAPRSSATRSVDSHTWEEREEKAVQPKGPLFHLRLLWRLLHIMQLFYAIGRQASLPRSAVHAYVQSSSCAYGIREVLRVLGADLAMASLTSHAERQHTSSLPDGSPCFSRDEVFQLFYASLCVSREEAPGVPIYDLTTAANAARSGDGSSASSSSSSASGSAAAAALLLLRFQQDCITTGSTAARMPMDEWCVRWWCHVYALHTSPSPDTCPATSSPSSSSTPTSEMEKGMTELLTVGQAMDVIRASLYATLHNDAGQGRSSSSFTSGGGGGRALLSRRVSAGGPSVVSPFLYFETPPRGAARGGRVLQSQQGDDTEAQSGGGGHKHEEEEEGATTAAPTNSTSAAAAAARSSSHSSHQTCRQHERQQRYRPRLVGALGGDRTLLRIPFHLGQRFVALFLEHLLSTATSTRKQQQQQKTMNEEEKKNNSGADTDSSQDASAASAAMPDTLRALLSSRDRDAVRDVALLCTAILFFEVFSAETAAFMAHAAPMCAEQAELLTGHEVSCVLLAYATLQRWQGKAGPLGVRDEASRAASCSASQRDDASAAATKTKMRSSAEKRRGEEVTTGEMRSASNSAKASPSSAAERDDRVDVYTVETEGDDVTSNGSGDTPWSTQQRQRTENSRTANAVDHDHAPGSTGRHHSDDGHPSAASQTSHSHTHHHQSQHPFSSGSEGPSADHEGAKSSSSSSSLPNSWQAFYVTLGSRAGQLSDTLSEEDVTRVLRAMELAGLEHDDLRRAMESSLRMRNLGRRMLYET